MRYGIFADIHANLEAFTVVIKELKKREVSRFVCAGDIVGYGPNPEECISLIRDLGYVTPALQMDLQRLKQARVPVGLVFEQGADVLGLK